MCEKEAIPGSSPHRLVAAVLPVETVDELVDCGLRLVPPERGRQPDIDVYPAEVGDDREVLAAGNGGDRDLGWNVKAGRPATDEPVSSAASAVMSPPALTTALLTVGWELPECAASPWTQRWNPMKPRPPMTMRSDLDIRS